MKAWRASRISDVSERRLPRLRIAAKTERVEAETPSLQRRPTRDQFARDDIGFDGNVHGGEK
jgi:hypothetical protein